MKSSQRSMYSLDDNASCSSSSEDEEITLDETERLGSEHFPARIVAFVPAMRGRKELYALGFEDGIERRLEREWFFAEGEKGFGECKVRGDLC